MTFKKLALITALLIGSVTAAFAGPYSAPTNAENAYFDRTSDAGPGAGGA